MKNVKMRVVLCLAAVLSGWMVSGQVTLGEGPLLRFREGGKTAFLGQIDPDEHVLGFASVGDQENGVANARQEFCGHYLDLCATYWQLDRCEKAVRNGRLKFITQQLLLRVFLREQHQLLHCMLLPIC